MPLKATLLTRTTHKRSPEGSSSRQVALYLRVFQQPASAEPAADGLSEDGHCQVDNATRQLASRGGDWIIEGTFLDTVMLEVPECLLVRLFCKQSVRHARYKKREAKLKFDERDANDSSLRDRLYSGAASRVPDLEVDTTFKTADAVADEIATWIRDRTKVD